MASFTNSPSLNWHGPEPVYRRHNRKKSSQILIEPSGLPANYVPMSPTLVVPHGLESVLFSNPPNSAKDQSYSQITSNLHSQPPSLVVPTSRDNISPAHMKQSGHARASSLQFDFGSSKPMNLNQPSHIKLLPTDLKLDSSIGSLYPTLDSPPKTPIFSRSPSFHSRNRSRSSSIASMPLTPTVPILPSPRPPVISTSPEPQAYAMVLYGITSLIASHVISKMFSFILNQAILRMIGPINFGESFQLELLVHTILFFSREAGRLATQRQSLFRKSPDIYRFGGGVVANTVSGTSQEVVNMGFVSVAVGIPVSIFLSGLYYKFNPSPSPNHLIAMGISVCAAFIELFSEPTFLLFQLKLKFGQRAMFQSIAVGFNCLVTFVLTLLSSRLVYAHEHYFLITFAIGKLAYASAITAMYIYSGIKEGRSGQYQVLFRQPVWNQETTLDVQSYLNSDTKALASSFWVQNFFKYFFSEGAKLLITVLLPVTDQGLYAILENYGSIIAWLVFFPIEETVISVFSKLLSKKSSGLAHCTVIFASLLRLYIYISLFIITFIPVLDTRTLQLFVSSKWLSPETYLPFAAYTVYIPFSAINGALEAFIQSVATPNQIRRQSSTSFIFPVCFAITAYLLTNSCDLGVTGLICAKFIDLCQRIVWCSLWITSYYQHQVNKKDDKDGDKKKEKRNNDPIKQDKPAADSKKQLKRDVGPKKWGWLRLSIPSPAVLAFVVATMATSWFALGKVDSLQSLGYQCFLALVLTIVVGIAEWELIRKLLQLIFGEKMENTKSEVKNVKVGKTGLDLVEKAKQTKRSEKAENISFKDNEDVKKQSKEKQQ